jgi:hypothetical protein
MMFEIICPHCGAQNLSEAERCSECDARLFGGAKGTNSSEETSVPDEISFDRQDEPDLPDLLHALKQDGEITSNGQVFERNAESHQQGPNPKGMSQSEGDVPDWLQRIRARAREEADAAGEITQKLSAAQESIKDSSLESQEENFSSWIHNLRGEPGEKGVESPKEDRNQTNEDGETPEETPQWLSSIRKVQGTTPGEDLTSASDPDEKQGDSLLQWLVALEEGKDEALPIPEEPGERKEAKFIESQQKGFEDGLEPGQETQRIPAPRADSQSQKLPELDVSREEKLQADLFSSTVADEHTQRPLRERKLKKSSWALRFFAAVLLIGILSLTLFRGLPIAWFDGASAGQGVILASFKNLPEGASLMLVADYQAGFADEIHLIAEPVLREAFLTSSEIGIISTQPSGMLLSKRLLADLPIEADVEIIDFGYYPSPILSAYAVGGLLEADQPWAGFPQALAGNLPSAIDGVFILGDSYDSARFWVEQLNVRLPDVPLYLLVTAQAGPMLAPYLESGQVAGLLAGIGEADVLAEGAFIAEGGLALYLKSAYQAGTLLMAVMIVIGAIFAIKPKKKETKDEGFYGME